MRLAAEQLREVAQGESPGNAPIRIVKLRSSDVYATMWKINVAAQQLFRTMVTMTCGFTAGYQPPLLRSESQRDNGRSLLTRKIEANSGPLPFPAASDRPGVEKTWPVGFEVALFCPFSP